VPKKSAKRLKFNFLKLPAFFMQKNKIKIFEKYPQKIKIFENSAMGT
jgi:hypothetical protein